MRKFAFPRAALPRYDGEKFEKRCIMVNLEHVSASLRLVNVQGEKTTNVRTFSGVRRNAGQAGVASFMSGINMLREVRATNAVLTTRAVMAPVQ